MRTWFVFLFCLACFSSQAHEYRFRPLPPDYSADIQEFTVFYQSADGFMWLGTDHGLYVYDGKKFKQISRPDQIRNTVTAITEYKGHVWTSFEDGTFLISDYEGTVASFRDDRLKDIVVSKLVSSPDGSLYITTYSRGLWIYRDSTVSVVNNPALANLGDVYDAIIDRQYQLWLATDDGVRILDIRHPEKITSLGRDDGLRDEIITRLAMDSTGRIMAGLYDMGVQVYNPTYRKFEDVFQWPSGHGNLTGLIAGPGSRLWAATERSVWHGHHELAFHAITLNTLLSNRINAIYLDRSANLWLAAGNRLYLANAEMEYLRPGLNSIQAILPVGHSVWYGTADGLYRTDENGDGLQRFLSHEKINVLSLYRDPEEILWIGTFGQGLYIFDPKSQRVLHLGEKDHLSNTSILNIDGKGHEVWIATLGGVTGLSWKTSPFDGSLTVTDLQQKYGFPNGYVYDVYSSPGGKVWFGTDGKGLFYLEGDQLHDFPVEVMLNDTSHVFVKTVYSLAEDDAGKLWLSTPKGMVWCVDDKGRVVESRTTSQGKINSIVVDGVGDVLLIREGEIYNVTAAIRLIVTDESSGFSSFSPNINATAVDPDGSVWIADQDMILHYDPFKPEGDHMLKMSFEMISPAPTSAGRMIELKPNNNLLDISYTGIWYADPSSLVYRYRLEGHDKDWIITREQRVLYSRLAPGKYTFVVQVSRDENFDSAPSLVKTILVRPPLYLRWWFVLSGLLFLAAVVSYLIRARIRRLNKVHELEKEKTMLQLHAIQAQVNPHFLFNSFNTLSSIIEEDQGAAVDYVDQLSSFFRGALLHRTDELITISQEMDIVRNYVYILEKRYGDHISIVEKIAANVSGWIAPLSIQLLVENAIKHNTVSREKHLAITIAIDHDWVEVSNPVQPKFQSMNESTGFGLSSLMARYAYLTRKKIEVTRETGQFVVRIPIIYPDQKS